jgi:hypothetical protein
MDLHRRHRKGFVVGEPDWEIVGVWDEDWVGRAFKTGDNVCPEILETLVGVWKEDCWNLR